MSFDLKGATERMTRELAAAFTNGRASGLMAAEDALTVMLKTVPGSLPERRAAIMDARRSVSEIPSEVKEPP